MSIVQVLLLSIVEGLTEFLPVSSTGHLILSRSLLGIPDSPFIQSFILIIQLGAILAVVQKYWRLLITREYWLPLLVAFIPTVVLGFLLYDQVKLLFGNENTTALMLLLGGFVLLFIDRIIPKKDKPLSLQIALVVGLSQVVSFIPGVSRAAATIIGGLSAGLSKEKAVEFSFLLAVPTLTAAVVLDLTQSPITLSSENITLLSLGTIGAFITASLAIRWFISYVSKKSFAVFGLWRIGVAVMFWLLGSP